MQNAGSPVVSLPWYDTPISAARIDAFWGVLKLELESRLPVVPIELDRCRPLHIQWQDPGLLLSQCCGPDLESATCNQLIPLMRPVFSDLECEPGRYYSHIIQRPASSNITRAAINSITSQSGFHSLKSWLGKRAAELTFVTTGSHQASIDMLRRGEADIAAIDAHSWPLLNLTGANIIDRSQTSLTPPFICHRESLPVSKEIQAALSSAVMRAGELLEISAVIVTTRRDYSTSKSMGSE